MLNLPYPCYTIFIALAQESFGFSSISITRTGTIHVRGNRELCGFRTTKVRGVEQKRICTEISYLFSSH